MKKYFKMGSVALVLGLLCLVAFKSVVFAAGATVTSMGGSLLINELQKRNYINISGSLFETVVWIEEVDGAEAFKVLNEEELTALTEEELPKYWTAFSEHHTEQMAKMVDKEEFGEEMLKVKASIELATKECSKLGVEIKSIEEKADESKPEDKSEFLEYVQSDDRAKFFKDEPGGFKQHAIKVPATMMVATNITGANDFSSLVGNFIDQQIHSVPKPRNFILDLVSVVTQPGTEKIWWSERVNEEGDALFIGEGDLKPLVDGEWLQQSADIKEVAERWKESKRLQLHAPRVIQDFRKHADELIHQLIDTQVLTGDGLGDNLDGIINQAAAFVAPTELADTYTAANIFDAICAVATTVNLANFEGDLTCVLNSVWKAKMKQLKDVDERYIMPPFVTPNGEEVAGVRIVFSNKMADDQLLLGELKRFNVVFAEQVMFDEGWMDDDFGKNLVSKKLEAFLGTYFPASDAGSIISDDIATILLAIDVL